MYPPIHYRSHSSSHSLFVGLELACSLKNGREMLPSWIANDAVGKMRHTGSNKIGRWVNEMWSVFILSTYHLLLLRAIPYQKHCNLLPKSLTASSRRNATLLVASHSIACRLCQLARALNRPILPSRSSFYFDFFKDGYVDLGRICRYSLPCDTK